MKTDFPKDKTPADSPLSAVPSPSAIQERMAANAAENRLLRSLFKVARRIHRESERRCLPLATAADNAAKPAGEGRP